MGGMHSRRRDGIFCCERLLARQRGRGSRAMDVLLSAWSVNDAKAVWPRGVAGGAPHRCDDFRILQPGLCCRGRKTRLVIGIQLFVVWLQLCLRVANDKRSPSPDSLPGVHTSWRPSCQYVFGWLLRIQAVSFRGSASSLREPEAFRFSIECHPCFCVAASRRLFASTSFAFTPSTASPCVS